MYIKIKIFREIDLKSRLVRLEMLNCGFKRNFSCQNVDFFLVKYRLFFIFQLTTSGLMSKLTLFGPLNMVRLRAKLSIRTIQDW